jgi:hypothetical protein
MTVPSRTESSGRTLVGVEDPLARPAWVGAQAQQRPTTTTRASPTERVRPAGAFCPPVRSRTMLLPFVARGAISATGLAATPPENLA